MAKRTTTSRFFSRKSLRTTYMPIATSGTIWSPVATIGPHLFCWANTPNCQARSQACHDVRERPCHFCIDRNRVPRRLDRRQRCDAVGPIRVVRHEHAERQLRQGDNGNLSLGDPRHLAERSPRLGRDEERGIEQRLHASSVVSISSSLSSARRPESAAWRETTLRASSTDTDRRRRSGTSSATGRRSTVTVTRSPPSTRRSTALTVLRNSRTETELTIIGSVAHVATP